LAIQIHCQRAGYLGDRPVQDLDLIASDFDVVAPSATAEFLVSHYHLPTPCHPKFLIQLVDPVARFRVDLFPDLQGSISRATQEVFEGLSVPVVQASDILEHKLQTLRKASPENPVDPKHLEDARVLSELLGMPVPSLPPDHLEWSRYGTDPTARCSRCDESRSSAFPLAPKEEILAVLGYV
jgi:hypothetical protein